MTLTPEEEISVLEWVEKRDALGISPKHRELVRMVINLHNRNHEGDAAIRNLGDHYVTRFLARHKEVATIVSKAMDRERMLAQNPEKLEDFFKRLSDCITCEKIDPEDFWNFDEKGFQMGKGGGANELVISRVRVKTPGKRMQQGNREWVTLIETVSAVGKVLPAFYIYAGKAHYAGWHNKSEIDSRTVFSFTDNGWTRDYISLRWLKTHFDVFAPPSKPGQKRLLLCDNHSSHVTYEFIEFCLEKNIVLFFFPSHATHILQPLDVGVFGPLARYCAQEVDAWIAIQPLHTSLLKGDFIPLCEKARKKAFTSSTIRSAWAACGIHPLNKIRVLTDPKVNASFQNTGIGSLATTHNLRALPQRPPLSQAQKIRSTLPSNLDDAIIQIKNLQNALTKAEADATIAREELRQYMARDKPATKSRKVLSRARYISQRDLMDARRGVVDPLDKTQIIASKKRLVRKRKALTEAEDSSGIDSDEDLAVVQSDTDSDNNSEEPESDSDGSNYSPAHSDVLNYPSQAQIPPTTSPGGESSLPSGPAPYPVRQLRRSHRNQPYSK